MNFNINSNLIKYQQIGGFQQGNKAEKAEEVSDNKTALKTIAQLIKDLKTGKISPKDCVKQIVESGLGNVKVLTNAKGKNVAEVANSDKKVTINTNYELNVEGAETVEETQSANTPRRVAQSNSSTGSKTSLDNDDLANLIDAMTYSEGNVGAGGNRGWTTASDRVKNQINNDNFQSFVKEMLEQTTLGLLTNDDFDAIYTQVTEIVLSMPNTVYTNSSGYCSPISHHDLAQRLIDVFNIKIKLNNTEPQSQGNIDINDLATIMTYSEGNVGAGGNRGWTTASDRVKNQINNDNFKAFVKEMLEQTPLGILTDEEFETTYRQVTDLVLAMPGTAYINNSTGYYSPISHDNLAQRLVDIFTLKTELSLTESHSLHKVDKTTIESILTYTEGNVGDGGSVGWTKAYDRINAQMDNTTFQSFIKEILNKTSLNLDSDDDFNAFYSVLSVYVDNLSGAVYKDNNGYCYPITHSDFAQRLTDFFNFAISLVDNNKVNDIDTLCMICQTYAYVDNNKDKFKGIVTTNAECNREFQAYAILTMSDLEKTLHEAYDAELGKEQVTLLYKQVASQAACNPENFEASGKYNNDNQMGAYGTWNANIRTDNYAPDDTAYRVIPEKLIVDFLNKFNEIKNRELQITDYNALSDDVKQELHNIAKCLPENNFIMHNEGDWNYSSTYAQYFGAEPTFKGEYIFNAEIGMDPSEKLNQRHHTNNYNIKNGQGYNDEGEDMTFNTSHCHEIIDIIPDAIDMMHNMIPIMSQYFDTGSDEFNDALYRTMKGLNDLINDVIIMYEGKPSSMSQEEYSAKFAKYNLSNSDIKNNKITMNAYLRLFGEYGIDVTATACGHENCSCHGGFNEHYSIDLSILMDKFIDTYKEVIIEIEEPEVVPEEPEVVPDEPSVIPDPSEIETNGLVLGNGLSHSEVLVVATMKKDQIYEILSQYINLDEVENLDGLFTLAVLEADINSDGKVSREESVDVVKELVYKLLTMCVDSMNGGIYTPDKESFDEDATTILTNLFKDLFQMHTFTNQYDYKYSDVISEYGNDGSYIYGTEKLEYSYFDKTLSRLGYSNLNDLITNLWPNIDTTIFPTILNYLGETMGEQNGNCIVYETEYFVEILTLILNQISEEGQYVMEETNGDGLRVVTTIESDGYIDVKEYNGDKLVKRTYTEPNGYYESWEYTDGVKTKYTEHYSDTKTEVTEYNSNGNVISFTEILSEYDNDGKLVKETTTVYDQKGNKRQETVIDNSNNTTTVKEFDSYENLLKQTVTDALGYTKVVEYEYNGDDNLSKETITYGNIVTIKEYNYSGNGVLVETTITPNGKTIKEYDEDGNLVKTTKYDKDGKEITDENGKIKNDDGSKPKSVGTTTGKLSDKFGNIFSDKFKHDIDIKILNEAIKIDKNIKIDRGIDPGKRLR